MFGAPGGVGTASVKLPGGATVGVLVVVNALGDIVDPESGQVLRGARSPSGRGWLNTSLMLREMAPASASQFRAGRKPIAPIANTTLAVVAAETTLTKAQARRVATMAHDGMARAIRPVHTMFDGDTVFALSTGEMVADVTAV